MNLSRNNIANRDLLCTIKNGWSGINENAKRAFIICLVTNIVVYLVFIIHQPMHNHGILSRLLYMNPYEQWDAGRWFSVAILKLFNSSNLMIVLPMVTIALHIAGGMLAVRIWRDRPSVFELCVGGLLVSLYPAVMTSFNFSFVGPIFSAPHLLAPCAILVGMHRQPLRIFFGAIIVCIMMATYQPGLSLVSTLFVTSCLVILVNSSGGYREIWDQLRQRVIPGITMILVGVLLYKISLDVFGIPTSQTTETIGLGEAGARLFQVARESIKALYLTQPEMGSAYKNTLAGVLAIAFSILFFKISRAGKSFSEIFLRVLLCLVLFTGALIAPKAMFLISDNNQFWNYRYNHALAYLYLFGFWVLFRYTNFGSVRNFAYLALGFVLISSAYANIGRQQVLLRSQTHYLSTANRILYRIESLPNIDYEKMYKIVRLGTFSDFKIEQLSRRGHSAARRGGSHLDAELSPIWGPGDIFNFLGSRIKLQGYMNPNFETDMDTAAELAKNHGKWPAADSVFIHGDLIIIKM
jgi:Glucosyl transferase GtrII